MGNKTIKLIAAAFGGAACLIAIGVIIFGKQHVAEVIVTSFSVIFFVLLMSVDSEQEI